MKFRAKPFEIEAFQLGIDSTPDWFIKSPHNRTMQNGTVIELETKSGWVKACHGDFIINGRNELYPVKPGVFHRKYEACVFNSPRLKK